MRPTAVLHPVSKRAMEVGWRERDACAQERYKRNLRGKYGECKGLRLPFRVRWPAISAKYGDDIDGVPDERSGDGSPAESRTLPHP